MSEVTAVPIRPLRRGTLVRLWLGVLLVCLAAAALAWAGTGWMQEVRLPGGARYRALAAGSGARITPADVFALNYRLHVGSLDAPVIQDSTERGQPFVATTADVYPGFAEALQQMRPGGRYLLWLPPGTHVTGPAPPGAPFRASDTLVFELHVLQVAQGQAQAYQMQRLQQMMMQQQQQQQGAAGGEAGAGAAPPGNSSEAPAGRGH
jgi:FKBP-type peptidyl-prolyl cis-trans isomerase FkpA